MSTIKFQEVLRCSSEDECYPARNLINGSQRWLSSKKQQSDVIEVEILLQKETAITFVDIGNEGSQFVDLLVSHSTRSKDEYFTLLPTFTFMSVAECKQKVNRRKVLMFKKDDMMANVRDKSWDKLKIVCRQTFSKDTQFGLSFILLRALNSLPKGSSIKMPHQVNCNQKALNSFFGLNESSPKASSENPLNLTSSNMTLPPVQRKMDKQKVITPSSSKPSPEVQTEDHYKFIDEVSCFLDELDEDLISHPELKVLDLRLHLEERRATALTKTEKKLFMVIISEKKQELNRKFVTIPSPVTAATTTTATTTTKTTTTIGNEEKCNNCGVTLPPDIASIHSKICTTPKQRNSRNSVCMDLAFTDDDELPTNTHHRKLKRSGSYKLPAREFFSSQRKSSGSYNSEAVNRPKGSDHLEISNTDEVFQSSGSCSSAVINRSKGSNDLEINNSEDVFQPPSEKKMHLDKSVNRTPTFQQKIDEVCRSPDNFGKTTKQTRPNRIEIHSADHDYRPSFVFEPKYSGKSIQQKRENELASGVGKESNRNFIREELRLTTSPQHKTTNVTRISIDGSYEADELPLPTNSIKTFSPSNKAGGITCCVPYCFNNSKKTPQLSFYVIPKDAELRARWLERINRKDFKPSTSHRVCSEHFTNRKKTYMNNVPTIFPEAIQDITSKNPPKKAFDDSKKKLDENANYQPVNSIEIFDHSWSSIESADQSRKSIEIIDQSTSSIESADQSNNSKGNFHQAMNVIENVDESASNKVECPMCCEKFDAKIIETHAAFCNGKTSPVAEQSTSCNTTSNDVIYVNNLEEQDEDEKKPDSQQYPSTQECPVCKEQISVYRIGIHSSLCSISNERKTAAAGSSTKPIVVTNGYSVNDTSHSSSIRSSSRCPICSNEFDASYINTHVNICLDATA